MSDLRVTVSYGNEVEGIVISGQGIVEMLNGGSVSDAHVVEWVTDNMRRIVREQVIAVLVGPAVDQFIETHVSDQQ